MQGIDKQEFKMIKIRKGLATGLELLAAIMFLFLLASGANAYVCIDCHETGLPHSSSCMSTDCACCHTGNNNVKHPAGSGTPSGCPACHTTAPHPTVGAGTSLGTACVTSACHGTGGAAHLFTAAGLVPYGAIHTALSVPSTECSACHGAGGIRPSEHFIPTATCSNCHTTRPGVASIMVLAHPDAPGAPSTACETCHTVGVKPTETTACATSTCHGPGGTAHLRNDLDTLRSLAVEMHVPADVPRALECTGCHDGVFQKPFAHPEGGATCSTCHSRAGVSPTDVETCKTCHDSGPAHKHSETTLATWAHDLHQFGAVTPSTDCTGCHVTLTTTEHGIGGEGPTGCTGCHTRPGVTPAPSNMCLPCHGVNGPGPELTLAYLTYCASSMHGGAPPAPNQPPTVTIDSLSADTAWLTTVNYTVADTDTPAQTLTVKVNWGDNTGDQLAGSLTTASHTYTNTGTFTVSVKVQDNGSPVLGASATSTVTVSKFTINGVVTKNDIGLTGVTITLSGADTGTYTSNSDGSYTFSKNPGTYTITPTKDGETFTPTSTTVTIGGNSTGNNFAATTYLMTVNKSGTSGTITSSPSGISCGTDCTETYSSGEAVTVTATPGNSAHTTTIAGCDSGTVTGAGARSCVVTMTGPKTVTVTFAAPANPVLTVTKTNGTSGNVTGIGISCGTTCTATKTLNSLVTLTATPVSGKTFTSWGAGCYSNPAPNKCVVKMDTSKTINATFAP